MQIQGKVVSIGEVQSGTSARGSWARQEVIIEQTSNYNKTASLRFTGNKVNLVQVGDNIDCEIDIESRQYKDKWYTDLIVKRFDKIAENGFAPTNGAAVITHDSTDDLPFLIKISPF